MAGFDSPLLRERSPGGKSGFERLSLEDPAESRQKQQGGSKITIQDKLENPEGLVFGKKSNLKTGGASILKSRSGQTPPVTPNHLTCENTSEGNSFKKRKKCVSLASSQIGAPPTPPRKSLRITIDDPPSPSLPKPCNLNFRAYTDVKAITRLSPLKIYIHNESIDFIKSLTTTLSTLLELKTEIRLQNYTPHKPPKTCPPFEIISLDPDQLLSSENFKARPPTLHLTYCYIDPIKLEVATMTNT